MLQLPETVAGIRNLLSTSSKQLRNGHMHFPFRASVHLRQYFRLTTQVVQKVEINTIWPLNNSVYMINRSKSRMLYDLYHYATSGFHILYLTPPSNKRRPPINASPTARSKEINAAL